MFKILAKGNEWHTPVTLHIFILKLYNTMEEEVKVAEAEAVEETVVEEEAIAEEAEAVEEVAEEVAE